jgi:hypothetical protein
LKKLAKRALIAVAVVFGLLQLTNPARTNPPVLPERDLLATNPPPANIVALLRRACYDCHSHETRWPWYSRIAPMSWSVAAHVKDGRRHLNFSNWPHDAPRKARANWQNTRDEVEAGDMPLRSYSALHAEARLTEAERGELAAWADAEAKRLTALVEAEAAR